MSPPAPSSRPPTGRGRCEPLDAEALAAARRAISDLGLGEAARRLELSRHTLANAAGGARLREGTRMVIADRLRRLDAKGG